jgi:hypothetical protein
MEMKQVGKTMGKDGIYGASAIQTWLTIMQINPGEVRFRKKY